jgi:HD-GYP domain-containing protein (c-di-GMP phosphodiesterase class II)
MKTIRTSDLKDGMLFDKPVYVDGENVFVPPNIPIRQKDIERLVRWEIPEVRTDGDLVQAKKESTKTAEEPSTLWEPPKDMKVLGEYDGILDECGRIFAALSGGNEVDHVAVDALVGRIMELVRQSRSEVVQLILMGEKAENKTVASAVNTTVLAIIIGMGLKYTGHHLNQLAIGALLHDVGMLKVPEEILSKKEKLNPEELNQIKTHPIHSYRVVSKTLKYPEEIGLIALQHHERWDGQGYPRKLKGEDISAAARIVTVADAYIAMVNERPYRNSVIGYNAMKTLLSDNGRHFDPKILKAFLESMGIYPIGSVVQLNNSSIGRVVETHMEAPLRPVLELIVDEYGNRIAERETLDLQAKKGLFIVKAVDPKVVARG